jgi:hypothetical protein
METIEKPAGKFNKQLFENSGLAGLFEETKAASPSETFFNARLPNLAVMHEKPEHRLLLLLKLRGMTNREIAETSGYTEPWLSQVFRQPWAVRTMAQISAESGAASIKGLLESECVPSIMRLVELRDAPTTPPAVVKSACDSLIEKFLGKPAQQVTITQDTRQVDSESVAELDREIENLKAEERTLMGHN